MSKKLSPAQTRFLERLASGTDGCHMPPFGCPGATASGWYRTAQSLHDRGLVVFTGSQAFFPRKFAEREMERTERELKEARTTLKRCSHWRSVKAAEEALAEAEAAHKVSNDHLRRTYLTPRNPNR